MVNVELRTVPRIADPIVGTRVVESREKLSPEKHIAIHKYPDFDAIGSAYVIKRFFGEGWRNAQVEFVEIGKSFGNVTRNQEGDFAPIVEDRGKQYITADTGGGYFDHHQHDNDPEGETRFTCAMELVWDYARQTNSDIPKDVEGAASLLIDHARDIDHRQQAFWKSSPGEASLPLYQVIDAIKEANSIFFLPSDIRDPLLLEYGEYVMDSTVYALTQGLATAPLNEKAQETITQWAGENPDMQATAQYLLGIKPSAPEDFSYQSLSVIHVFNGLPAIIPDEQKRQEVEKTLLDCIHEFYTQQILASDKLIAEAQENGKSGFTQQGEKIILLDSASRFAEMRAYQLGYGITLMHFPGGKYGRITTPDPNKRDPESKRKNLTPIFDWLCNNDPMQMQLIREKSGLVAGINPEDVDMQDGWFQFKPNYIVSDNAKRPTKREPEIDWEEILRVLPTFENI